MANITYMASSIGLTPPPLPPPPRGRSLGTRHHYHVAHSLLHGFNYYHLGVGGGSDEDMLTVTCYNDL